jgi:hypothetical protein
MEVPARRHDFPALGAAALVLAVAGCGGNGPADELGAMTCAEMTAEADELRRTLEGDPADLPEYRYVAARIEESVESVLPGGANEGWTTWFQYYCADDESQTAEEAFDRAEVIVEEAGGPAAAQEEFLRVTQFEEPPPP